MGMKVSPWNLLFTQGTDVWLDDTTVPDPAFNDVSRPNFYEILFLREIFNHPLVVTELRQRFLRPPPVTLSCLLCMVTPILLGVQVYARLASTLQAVPILLVLVVICQWLRHPAF
jgi:hypothetical protein